MNPLGKGKILVTGGAGFIGSALVWALNRLNVDNILISDILGKDEKWRNLAPLRFDDYVSAETLLENLDKDVTAIQEIRWIFHLGACSSTTERDAGYLLENNYRYSQLLLEWAVKHNARFVYASSAATYGDGSKGMADDETKLESLRPLNAYGYSKQAFDLYVKRRGLLSRIVGLKYFNVFGPNEWHKGEMRSLVSKAFDQVRDRGSISLFRSNDPKFKDGEQKRDFLYVKDAVKMTIHLAVTRSANGIFNLGSGHAESWMSLAEAVFKAVDKPAKIEFIDMPETIGRNYQNFTQADIGKLHSVGYVGPGFSLEHAVKDYVQNYLVPERRLDPAWENDLAGSADRTQD